MYYSFKKALFFENLGLYYLSAILRSKGHRTDVAFFSHEKDMIGYIKENGFTVVGFSVFTGGHDFVMKMSERIKSKLPHVATMVGGPHITEFPKHLIKTSRGIDFEFFGEVDYQILDLVEGLESKNPNWGKIPNLTWRNGDEIVANDKKPVITNLDSLPYPHRELYYKYSFLRKLDLRRFLSGRGCPFKCSFCSIPLIMNSQEQAKSMRRHSVDRMIGELVDVKERFPTRSVHFHDDLFSLNRTWLDEFAVAYRKYVDIPFICNARFDTPSDTLRVLKEAGCKGVQLGLESADEEMRNQLLSKQLKQERIFEAAALLHEIGLKFLTTSIVNLPGETIDQAIATVDLNVKIKPNRIRVGQLMPIPSLPIVKYAKEKGFLPADYDIYNYNEPSESHLRTPYSREFFLVTQYAAILELFPSWRKWIYSLIKRKKLVGWLVQLGVLYNFYSEFRWFGFSLRGGLRFFFNVIRFGKGTKWGSWASNAKDFHEKNAETGIFQMLSPKGPGQRLK